MSEGNHKCDTRWEIAEGDAVRVRNECEPEGSHGMQTWGLAPPDAGRVRMTISD
jgi:hypothetical protein